jgi:3',5'-cyclic AMP phosphodiesterase CpdA
MPLSRREALKVTGLAAVGALAGPAAASPGAPARRTRSLRIAHLTDIHVEPERRAGEGMAQCLAHLSDIKDAPDLLITGGDHVYDSGEADEARTRTQWELFTKTLEDGCALPRLSVLGNHDCWGWDKKKSKTTGEEARWGKTWALDTLRMSARYHSSDRGGWHIVCLDSIQPNGDSYLGKIDDEQFEWLRGDLAAVKPETPVLIVSHIPILAACIFFNSGDARAEQVAPARMHTDAGRLKSLFLMHPNVKVAISGHIHLIDRVDYDGVTYFCNGAVSGNWWKGRHQECDEGYTLLDLFDDGTFERQYITYGWKAQPAK